MKESQNNELNILIINLPTEPHQTETYPLELRLNPQRQKGMFLYQAQPLWMSGSYEEVRRSDGYTTACNRTFKRFSRCKWLCCWTLGYWLQHQPKSFNRTELAGEHHQDYRENGFKFDEVTQRWYNCWEYREVFEVYHTTHRQGRKIDLMFDAIAKQGKYVSYYYSETLD
ncbi:hypothetical protein [Oscillatoria sp. FACHB-1406]|uniref:hypothetical protein n=1 Tax=Oscillatoria sp. FACHB-1406 TaxID=2692846 RepID=UPI001685012E|nr:hypothetical protein [Oscillatoria sp. FACHB-1406]MBD2580420.1 hypothetical protein [Oscillatoria sp. FACHB-1406]